MNQISLSKETAVWFLCILEYGCCGFLGICGFTDRVISTISTIDDKIQTTQTKARSKQLPTYANCSRRFNSGRDFTQQQTCIMALVLFVVQNNKGEREVTVNSPQFAYRDNSIISSRKSAIM